MNRRRWLAIAAAALAVVLGGGAALAATGSRNPASDFVGDVAKRLGISQDRLEDAIQEATIARIDAAVAAGDITKAQGDALKQRVRSGEMPPILPTVRGPGFSHGLDKGIVPGFLPGSDLMAAAAGYIGMDEAEVREALRDGKSLADLAEEQGKSVDGLKTALRDEIREDADRAVGDGVLTKEQADRLVEKLSVAVDELVDKPGGPEFDRHGPGFGPAPPGPLEKAIVPRFLPGDLVETAADYLGMDEADLREALRDGQSLANLARDKGKSVDGLKRALRGAVRVDSEQAVEDGVMTKEHADRLVEKLGNAIDKLVEGSLSGGFDFEFRGGGDGFKFRFRVQPDDRVPVPDERSSSSFEPPIVPLQTT